VEIQKPSQVAEWSQMFNHVKSWSYRLMSYVNSLNITGSNRVLTTNVDNFFKNKFKMT
jgi:hypothetical protein